MSDIPFHVAGGSFVSASPKAIDFTDFVRPPSLEEAPGIARGSRRRRLWEIPHKFHCPIIGSCFEVSELRALMGSVIELPAGTTDFVLHTTAVGACEKRSRLAERLHKKLESRYQLVIRHFASAKDDGALRRCWQDALRGASEIPAALWAAWTHPACDERLAQEIYGEIHMIQHQIGSGTRSDLRLLDKLKAENRQLRQMLEGARQETAAARSEKACETQSLTRRIAELRAEQVGRDACIASLTAQLDQLRSQLPDLRDRQSLARRASDAEARLAALSAHVASQQDEIGRLQQRLKAPDNAAAVSEPQEIETPDLSGKCVLCVGGRSGAVDAYRQLVEMRGGRFLHHDGGLEESLHRIDGALAAADLVICQAGCISHNAYWRVKEQCKRTGKPCVFVKGAGVSSFGRVVGAACASFPETGE